MKGSNIFFVTLVLLCFIGCFEKENLKFERKDELINYLNEIHDINLTTQNKSFIVLISGHCGSCTKATVDFLERLGNDERFTMFDKYVIVPEENNQIIPSLKILLKNKFKILEEENIRMMRYGILFPKNVFLELRNDKIKFWGYLYMDEIYDIETRYFEQ